MADKSAESEFYSIPREIKARWQNIADTIAATFEVPAAVITSSTGNTVQFTVSSQTQNNPFSPGTTAVLSSSSYFEKVQQAQKKVVVLNAHEDPVWSNHIEENYGMVSFLGFPLSWSTGELYGTLSVVDDRPRNYAQSFQDLLYHLSTLINGDLQMIEAVSKMEEMASIDSLTNLRNRKSLEMDFDYEISRAVRFNQPLSILAVDINNFRNINEFYGFSSGDVVLIETASTLQKSKRKVDKLYRVGGDDFIILLPDTPKDTLLTVANRIRKELGSMKFLDAQISISLAVSGTQWEQGEPWILVQRRLETLMAEVKGMSGASPQIS